MKTDLLLGIAILLLFSSVFLVSTEGFMDGDVMSIQNDLTLHKVLVDKQLKSMNMILEKEPDDRMEITPILKKMGAKLQVLVKEGKPENARLIKQLKDLKQRAESVPLMMEAYRTEVKKLSETKVNGAMTVKEFLPAYQTFIGELNKDVEKMLKE